jgi:phospholipid/cholesterol/gamma-HCH transport system substrate-binding protein
MNPANHPELPQRSAQDAQGQVSEERFRFRHVNAITGTFVLVTTGLLIAAFLFAGRSQRWFIGNVTLRIVLPEAGAAGIKPGSEVYFLGTRMGTVWDVSVEPTGRMEAWVNIRRDFFRFVRADSSAVVKRKFGVAGDSFFEITRGHGQPLPEKNASIVCNDQLPSALETAIDEIRSLAVPALNKLSAGLDTWTALGSNLITTKEQLDQLLARGNGIAAGLQEGKGSAGELLTDASTAEELKTLLVKANSSLTTLEGTLDNLQSTSGNLQAASTNFPAISNALRDQAKDLPGLVMQTQISMRELERLIEGLQRHWLLRKYMNLTNPPSLRPSPTPNPPQKKPTKVLRSPRDAAR